MPRPPTTATLFACLIVTLWAAFIAGQDPAPTAAETGPEAEAAKRFQAYCKQAAATYEMRANSATGTK